MKQMTMMDFKHLSKAKIPEVPKDSLEDINELYAKDPLDKTRECTIQEVMMMIMNIREQTYTEQVDMERSFHQLLKAKDTKINAQSNLIVALQKKLSTVDKTLRGYESRDLYRISENHRQLLTQERPVNNAEKVMKEAKKLRTP